MKSVFILFPHHLFKDITPLRAHDTVFLVEEWLFFRQYKFHKQKLVFHRATMKAYESYLKENGLNVVYIDAAQPQSDIRVLIPELAKQGIDAIKVYDPTDEWLCRRLHKACSQSSIQLSMLESPLFMNSTQQLAAYMEGKKKYFQTDFYIYQRKYWRILVNDDLTPQNGQWSFDADNRLKYPKGKKPPVIRQTLITAFHQEAITYVQINFSSNYGVIDEKYLYAVDFKQAEQALACFFKQRFDEFGMYEDAIVAEEMHLHHAVISPLLNVGLLQPMDVIQKAIAYAQKNAIPFNSLEGFVRQIIGWREFIRMIYIREGNQERTKNHWHFKREMHVSFYTGETGVIPVDTTIKKLLHSAYSHHIERLMVLSNFMLLCEFDSNEVYQWFMEMYIDAYDWVMVPNVYGMGQFADGGIMATKPYISGSNYLFKMSNYARDEKWSSVWDGLFWRFLHVHRTFFLSNPRLGMLVKTFDKWNAEKQTETLLRAEEFILQLDKENNKK